MNKFQKAYGNLFGGFAEESEDPVPEDDGYTRALRAAGCIIIDSVSVGSYQGDHLWFVEHDGEKKIVHQSYGSCSVCDAFLSEFDMFADEETPEALKAFGERMLLVKQDEGVLEGVFSNQDWDPYNEVILRHLKAWRKML